MSRCFNILLVLFCILSIQALGQNIPHSMVQDFSPQYDFNTYFIHNSGQVYDQEGNDREDVKFYGEFNDLGFYLKDDGVSYVLYRQSHNSQQGSDFTDQSDESDSMLLESYRVDIEWLNASGMYSTEVADPISFYNFENTPSEVPLHKVPVYSSVKCKNVLSGIDLLWYQKNGCLKYDIKVAPHAAIEELQFRISGGKEVSIDQSGNLRINTPFGTIVEHAPLALQNGKEVRCNWVLNNDTVSFNLENYDRNYPLLIDPLVTSWSTYYGGSSQDAVWAIDSDDSLYLYVGGATYSSKQIATSGAHQTSVNLYNDMFLAKFTSAGSRVWGTYYGGRGSDYLYDLSITKKTQILLTGRTWSNNLISTTGAFQTSYSAKDDVVFAKFSRNGKLLYGSYYGDSDDEYGSSCLEDEDGNIYIGGISKSGSRFGTSNGFQTSNAGDYDIFITKFDSSFNRIWSTYIGGQTREDLGQVILGDSNKIYLCGWTRSTNFPVKRAFQNKHAAGYNDGIISKLDTSGALIWSTYYGGNKNDQLHALSLGDSNSVFITGATWSGSLATSGAHQTTHTNRQDVLLTHFSGNGVRDWTTYMGGAGDDGALAITSLGKNELVITGYTDSQDSIVGSGPTISGTFGGYRDVFLARFSTIGQRNWSTYFGSNDIETGTAVHVDSSNTIYMAGWTESDTSISTAKAHQSTFGGGTYSDGFVVKLGGCSVTRSSLKVSACNSWSPNKSAVVYKQSGTYHDTITLSTGCLRMRTFELTIMNNSHDTLNVSACDSFEAPSGIQMWDSSGVYHDTLTNSAGCDSLITVNLIIYKGTQTVNSLSSCVPITSPSNYPITQSGTYYDTLQSIKGCDSIIITNFTLLPKKFSALDTSVCNSFLAPDGITQRTQTGVYFDTLMTSNGCDSVVKTNLTIYQIAYQFVTDTFCNSYTSANGKIWDSTGYYSDTLLTFRGCDSIIEYQLTRIQPSRAVYDTACFSFVLPYSKRVVTSSGVYTEVQTSSTDCDTIVTYNLEVTQSFDVSITKTDSSLLANSLRGFYQWLDCGNSFAPISGQTGREFIPVRPNGSYAVQIGENNCLDTSDCTLYTGGNSMSNSGFHITFYPNPTGGILNLEAGSLLEEVDIAVFNSIGSQVAHYTYPYFYEEQIKLPDTSDVYFIRISNGKYTKGFMVVKN